MRDGICDVIKVPSTYQLEILKTIFVIETLLFQINHNITILNRDVTLCDVFVTFSEKRIEAD